MDKDELKKYLRDNPAKIKDVLEEIGCNEVVIRRKRISACRPDGGDNKGAISIKLNNSLSTSVYTKPEFMKYETRDLYTLLDFLCGYNLYESIKLIHKICGLEFNGSFKPKQKSVGYAFLKQFKRSVGNKFDEEFNEYILDENIMNQFFQEECKMFSDDNINSSTQRKFQICYDIFESRILIPIRNNKGELVSIKGRTCNPKYRENGLAKYIYYYEFQGERYLYGYYENRESITKAKEILVFEAEKSVMQCDSMGINNVVAISKKIFSKYQIAQLLKLGKDVVLCFDKDVTIQEIEIACKSFKGLCKVYYIWDKDNLLKDKESPSDKGRDILEELLNNKVLFKEEEIKCIN